MQDKKNQPGRHLYKGTAPAIIHYLLYIPYNIARRVHFHTIK